MYQVVQHREGIKASIGINGLLWEHDVGGSEWGIVSEHRRKADAIAAANSHPFRAVVTRYHSSDVIHDNGKVPGSRVTDNRPSPDVPINAPRGLGAYRLPM